MCVGGGVCSGGGGRSGVGVRGTVVLSLLFSSGQEMWVSSGGLREWHWLCEHLARHSSTTPTSPGV